MIRRRLAAVLVASASVLAACTGSGASSAGQDSPQAARASGAGAPTIKPWTPDPGPLVSAVPHRSPGDLDARRLGDGVIPPTNTWFAGLVFGDPQPVYALPLSFALAPGGFEVGAPRPVASATSVTSAQATDLTVDVGASDAVVTGYDAASVTLELRDGSGKAVAHAVLAQGSPYVSLTAAASVSVSVTGGTLDAQAAKGDAATLDTKGRPWRLVAPGAGSFNGTVSLDSGETATLYPVPDGATPDGLAALDDGARSPLAGVSLQMGLGRDGARTDLAYRTTAGPAKAVVTEPHQQRWALGSPSCDLGTYPSALGTLALCRGATISWQVPALEPAATPDVSNLDGQEAARLKTQLTKDVAATPAFAADSYFGGKDLYRAAQLVALGHELGADDEVAALAGKVDDALRTWTQPDGCRSRTEKCVVYDPVAHGAVEMPASFGTEVFNDHHFHAGYLVAAAALRAADNPRLLKDVEPVIDLLALDIANGRADATPRMRVFDAYSGHSWASGTAPFADGNNQESTSEAMAAWNALGLWAQVSDQPRLLAQARWMLSNEAASARTYWTEPDLADPAVTGFEHQVFGLVWGDKRDWATWFSADPSAVLGIQLIPMPPVDGALAADADHVKAAVREATPDGFDVQFGGYLAMYLALVDPGAARDAATRRLGLGDRHRHVPHVPGRLAGQPAASCCARSAHPRARRCRQGCRHAVNRRYGEAWASCTATPPQ